MGLIIDSSVLIAAERGKLDLDSLLARYPDEEAALATVTASELLQGVRRASTPEQKLAREAYVEGLLATFPLLAFDLPAAREHARMSADLARAGTPVGAHDALIAASALAAGYRVVTRDRRSFPNIPGLVVDLV